MDPLNFEPFIFVSYIFGHLTFLSGTKTVRYILLIRRNQELETVSSFISPFFFSLQEYYYNSMFTNKRFPVSKLADPCFGVIHGVGTQFVHIRLGVIFQLVG